MIEDQNKHTLGLKSLEQDFALQLTDIELLQVKNEDTGKQMKYIKEEIEQEDNKQLQLVSEISKIETQIDFLAEERMDVLERRDQKNFQLRDTQDDAAADMIILKRNTNWDVKLVKARSLFYNLSLMQENRVGEAFGLLCHFSDFDSKCYRTMNAYKLVLVKLKAYYQKRYLNLWFENALKPMETMAQNSAMCRHIYRRRLLTKVYSRWREQHVARMQVYRSKSHSINKIWDKLFLSATIELKRAVAIWKECVKYDTRQKRAVRMVLVQGQNSLLRQALLVWNKYSIELGQVCRVELLKQEYAQKFYMCSLFGALKEQVVLSKIKKHRQKRRVMKALQDYMQYRRQMAYLNMEAIMFLKQTKTYLLSQCFHQLRYYKERQKVKIMARALREDVDVSIDALNSFTDGCKQQESHKALSKAVRSVQTMLSRRLYSYMKVWRQQYLDHESLMASRVRDLLIRIHNGKRKSALDQWKANSHQKKIKRTKIQIVTMQSENFELERSAIEEANNTRQQSTAVSSKRNKNNNKVFMKYVKRRLCLAFERWRDAVNTHNTKFKHQNLVLRKMRARLMAEAFQIYKRVHLKRIEREQNEKKSDMLHNTLRLRTLRKHFNGLSAFICLFKRQQQKLKYMDVKIRHHWIQLSLKRWRVNIEIKQERKLQLVMEEHSNTIEAQTHILGEAENKKEQLS